MSAPGLDLCPTCRAPRTPEQRQRAAGMGEADVQHRIEAGVPEALDFLPYPSADERTARALVDRVLAAADAAVPVLIVEEHERRMTVARAEFACERQRLLASIAAESDRADLLEVGR